MVSNKEFVLPENAQEPLRKALKKHKNSYFYLILSKEKRKVIKIFTGKWVDSPLFPRSTHVRVMCLQRQLGHPEGMVSVQGGLTMLLR